MVHIDRLTDTPCVHIYGAYKEKLLATDKIDLVELDIFNYKCQATTSLAEEVP